MHWIPFPFTRIVLFFTLGILLGIHTPSTVSVPFLTWLLLVLLVLYFLTLLIDYNKRKILQGVIAFVTVFVCGYFHLVYQSEYLHQDHLINQRGIVEFYTVDLIKACEEKDNHWKTEASIRKLKIDGKWKDAQGRIQFYFSKKDFLTPYHYGDVLLIRGNPQEVQPPSNPGEFDYKRFLQFKNIYHQQFLRLEDVTLLQRHEGFKILEWSYKAREWSSTLIKKYIEGEREQGIASALVMGVNDGLDNELISAYASSGTLHVLSVSGLHVGIVYLILLFIFKPLNKSKAGRWILAILSIFILWGYAFITGLSPSVLRAVAMFSFVALSTPSSRRANIYNTLAISAFFLLLYDPFFIMSVGFQLSYLAVLGIVYIQPGLYKLWEPSARFWDELWKVTSVSIAAQVATFSLGLLYFHQFPNYFLLSNLLIIPLSSLILIAGIGLLTFSFIQPVAAGIGFMLTWMIKTMNALVFAIESFPFSRVENIYITNFQCIVLTSIVVALVVALKYKKSSYLYVFMVGIFVFSLVQWYSFYENFYTKKITFYKVPHHSAIDLFDRGISYFITDSALYHDDRKIKFHINPNRVVNRINNVVHGYDRGIVKHFDGGELIYWKGKYILRVTRKNFTPLNMPALDYLVIGNNSLADVLLIKKKLSFKKVIIDSSNSFYFADNILKKLMAHNIDVHSILHHGAFVDTF